MNKVVNLSLAKSRKYRQHKERIVQHMTLKCLRGSTLSYPEDDRINQDPDRASLCAIRKHMNSYPIHFNRDLFTVAQYDLGHYLIYDNREVMAYTILLSSQL